MDSVRTLTQTGTNQEMLNVRCYPNNGEQVGTYELNLAAHTSGIDTGPGQCRSLLNLNLVWFTLTSRLMFVSTRIRILFALKPDTALHCTAQHYFGKDILITVSSP